MMHSATAVSGGFPAPPSPPLTGNRFLSLGIWFGLLTGAGELAYLAIRKFGRQMITFRGGDTLWMTPVATALVFIAAGGCFWLLTGRLESARRLRWGVAMYLTLALTSGLWLLPSLHDGAAFVVALGIGAQTVRMLGSRLPAAGPLVRRTLPVLLGLTLLALAGVPFMRWWGERRALGRLPGAETAAPNILLLVLDTVRSLNLSVYGYPRPTTSGMERVAEQGTLFERAFSTAPWTLPSHASMLTGTWPHEQSTGWFSALDDRQPSVAEALSRAGYRTGAMVANVFYTSAETGLARGFSRYEDHPVTFVTFCASASLLRTVVNADKVRQVVGTEEIIGRKSAAEINHAFLQWQARDRTRPFFAFLNYYDAHTPYLPPDPWRTRFATPGIPLIANLERHGRRDGGWNPDQLQGAIDAYDGAIGYLDAEIARLLDSLRMRGVLDNTVVIITSDHGEEFNEHGLIHHGNSLHRPSVSIPLIVRWPGHVPANLRVSTPVSARDLAATMVDLAGVQPQNPLPGRSLRRYWEGDSAAADTLLTELRYAPQQPEWYPASKGNMVSAVWDGLRYIRTGDGAESLFDFDRDAEERANLATSPERAESVELFRRLIRGILESP